MCGTTFKVQKYNYQILVTQAVFCNYLILLVPHGASLTKYFFSKYTAITIAPPFVGFIVVSADYILLDDGLGGININVQRLSVTVA